MTDAKWEKRIIENPGDELSRQVYADWLEEHDEVEYGAAMRTVCTVFIMLYGYEHSKNLQKLDFKSYVIQVGKFRVEIQTITRKPPIIPVLALEYNPSDQMYVYPKAPEIWERVDMQHYLMSWPDNCYTEDKTECEEKT